ncbi:hypothetical protein [Sphaerisporangium album]|uniref:hypothetical protein n=1 Tax=Sphaerisporangium album TaxID=509200 RepID=UPI001FE2445F|nr:hypothetical protein [Sphaerisporangium album]
MEFEVTKAATFMVTHARMIDRRRFEAITTPDAPADALLAALAAYRNDDGGFGWGLEPDLRSPESQPAGALHAFEVLEEIGRPVGELATTLCDWLDSVSLPDGGLPFALPIGEPVGSAPWWLGADPDSSSLHITAAVAAAAHGVARHDPAVRDHVWLARATDHCRRAIADPGRPPGGAYELRFVLGFLDAIQDDANQDEPARDHATKDAGVRDHAIQATAPEAVPGAGAELGRLAARLPRDGILPVEGGLEGEALRPLDVSPWPDRPLRRFVPRTSSPPTSAVSPPGSGRTGGGSWTSRPSHRRRHSNGAATPP